MGGTIALTYNWALHIVHTTEYNTNKTISILAVLKIVIGSINSRKLVCIFKSLSWTFENFVKNINIQNYCNFESLVKAKKTKMQVMYQFFIEFSEEK